MVKRLLLVLGMHRSGTSCLTGLLGDAGVWLGPVEKGSPFNAKGNNENRQVMNVNKAVLAANDASWFAPPLGDAPWAPEHCQRADEILAETLADDRITAMKDPRSLFTGRGWWERAEAAGAQVSAIGTFRRPERVIASLLHREEDLDEPTCRAMWLAYNHRLLEFHDEIGFPIVDFDLPGREYLTAVERALARLGIIPPHPLEFFEEDLRHQSIPPAPDRELDDIHRELRRRAVS
jgi:hypothetical protein